MAKIPGTEEPFTTDQHAIKHRLLKNEGRLFQNIPEQSGQGVMPFGIGSKNALAPGFVILN